MKEINVRLMTMILMKSQPEKLLLTISEFLSIDMLSQIILAQLFGLLELFVRMF